MHTTVRHYIVPIMSESGPSMTWIEHVKKVHASSGKSWKEALVLAKESWTKKPKKQSVKKKGGDWRGHLKRYKEAHPDKSWKQCMQEAKLTYPPNVQTKSE